MGAVDGGSSGEGKPRLSCRRGLEIEDADNAHAIDAYYTRRRAALIVMEQWSGVRRRGEPAQRPVCRGRENLRS